ncbi:RNA polymerase sigma factor [Sphingomonas sp. VNH70]|uniref:RNA polymerase sigma factor n=1 Tax=Sphingomonas silueang TaxID=3156617 RepID=UPI0032B469B1
MAQAAGQALEHHWDELAAYLTRRTGDAAVAADLTQEAYLRAAALPGNTTLINPRAWLFAAARNLLVDHARRQRVRHATGAGDTYELARIPDLQPAAEAILLSREELRVLAAAIEALPPRPREVFRLHKFDGYSYGDIAQRLGIAKNTVMVHMVKALGQCRDALRRYRDDAETNGPAVVVRLRQHDV